jgi:hypothetical protein
MSTAYQIVVCAGIVPDPLQTLEPVTSPTGPALKNEMRLLAVLDQWGGIMRVQLRPAAMGQSGAPYSLRFIYAAARRAIEPLLGVEDQLDADQAEYFEALSSFTKAYDQTRVKWPKEAMSGLCHR